MSLVNWLSKVTVLLLIVAGSWTVQANQLSVMYGYPIQKQNIPLNTLDLFYRHSLYQPGTASTVYLEGTLGQIVTNAGNGTRIGIGLANEVKLFNWLSLELAGGVTALDRYRFVAAFNRKKDFGGPKQWYVRTGAQVFLNRDWAVGYNFYHMSNGRSYSTNPSINANSLLLSYQF